MLHVGNAPTASVLRSHAARWQGLRLADVIDASPTARAALRLDAPGLQLDYSRQRIDAEVLSALLSLARECELEQAISAMVSGEVLNSSEQRQVLHIALRTPLGSKAAVDSRVAEELSRLQHFVDGVHRGHITAPNGQLYTDVINVGVGGSDLGPRLVVDALGGLPQYAPKLKAHFLGNLDAAHIEATTQSIDPQRCLVVLVSKSFTTVETQAVAEHLRSWMRQAGADCERQFVAVTAKSELAQQAGIPSEQQFDMWDWVGGRFSLWSSVGLSAALALGWETFEELLAGAASMDRHFLDQPLEQNLPVIWALLGIWNRNFLALKSQVVAVYSERLAALPGWLQQLDMESNGKAVGRDGSPLEHATSPAVWGGVGTNVQHAFFQLLHQSLDEHTVDFVLPLEVPGMQPEMQRQLMANALGQSAALSHGRDGIADGLDEAAVAWRRCPGNRPSSLLWMDRLDARGLGQLLAAYEHRCFVQGWLWGLNSFDQFGVELGKKLAKAIELGLDGDDTAWPDALLQQQARVLAKL